ncbi:MAG: EFR1 family ferrodoxin [Phycisphaerae bacterium]
MKTRIYWFSGTGNSLHVAKRLAGGLDGPTELVPLSHLDRVEPTSAARVGLVFPVYGWGPPNLVARAIYDGLKLEGQPRIFAVVTCAASAGGTLNTTRNILRQSGQELSAGYVVKLPENYPPMGGPPGEEKRKNICAAAEGTIDDIIAALNAGNYSVRRANLFLRFLSGVAGRLAANHWPKADRKFTADDTCTRCGLCERICPVGEIERGADGKPTWLGRCEQCYACLHWCPVAAIQYGKKSRSQPRYHHPRIEVEDMLQAGQKSGTD